MKGRNLTKLGSIIGEQDVNPWGIRLGVVGGEGSRFPDASLLLVVEA